MKRKLFCIISLMLIVILSATTALAASSVSVSISAGSTTANSGDSVTFTVKADVDSCGSGGIEISYDSNVFSLVSGDWELSNAFMKEFSTSSKDGVFAFDSDSKISGTVFKFVLKVKDSASLGSSKVTVTFTADGISKSASVSVKVACAHSWNSGKVTKEATCTADGSKTYTCKLCGDTKTETISATGHSWNSGKVTTEATCSADGVVTYTCSTCGKTKTTALDALDHTYDNSCDTDCNVCGKTRTIEHSYEWKTDGENHWQECSVCGEQTESGPCNYAQELSWNKTQHGYACDVCGLFSQAEDHTFDNDCDTLCDICGYTRETTHIYSETWTGGADGHWHECVNCGDQLEIVPHTPGEEATETTDQVCLDCGYILQVAGNHVHSMAGDWLDDDEGHWFLCVCGAYTDPEPHSWDEGVIDEENSTITYSCTVCGHTLAEEYIAPTTTPTTVPTESESPTTPSDEPKKGSFLDFDFGLNLMSLLLVGLAMLLVISIGFNIFLLRCLFASKKTGKYARQDVPPAPPAPTAVTEPEPAADEEPDLSDIPEDPEA